MKAQELRIGNYVWDDYSGEMIVSQIEYATESCFLRKTWFLPDGRYLCKDIASIPLTEEWLLKFGFEPMKCITFDWQTEYIITPDKYGWSIGVLLGDYPVDNPNCGCVSIVHPEDLEVPGVPPDLYDKEVWTEEDEERAKHYTVPFEKYRQPIAYYIKYVHQLQNLYFALVGYELTIKS